MRAGIGVPPIGQREVEQNARHHGPNEQRQQHAAATSPRWTGCHGADGEAKRERSGGQQPDVMVCPGGRREQDYGAERHCVGQRLAPERLGGQMDGTGGPGLPEYDAKLDGQRAQ